MPSNGFWSKASARERHRYCRSKGCPLVWEEGVGSGGFLQDCRS